MADTYPRSLHLPPLPPPFLQDLHSREDPSLLIRIQTRQSLHRPVPSGPQTTQNGPPCPAARLGYLHGLGHPGGHMARRSCKHPLAELTLPALLCWLFPPLGTYAACPAWPREHVAIPPHIHGRPHPCCTSPGFLRRGAGRRSGPRPPRQATTTTTSAQAPPPLGHSFRQRHFGASRFSGSPSCQQAGQAALPRNHVIFVVCTARQCYG